MEKIIEVLKHYNADTERAVQSESDPAVLYAFSDLRENLLEWYPFEKGKKLLQIGSGAGAVTGLFLKKGLDVTVFETDPDEERVAKMRFSDVLEGKKQIEGTLSYVREVSDEDGMGAFDYVVLIGVMDRAFEWFPSQTPYEDLIRKAKEYVRTGGSLFVATANRMAVRYFSGAARLERGFTKKELEAMLLGTEDDGTCSWYYPIPDYRIPVSIYSDEYLPAPGEFSNLGAAYDAPRYQVISEEAALNICCEEGQFTNFTSSYLAVWRKKN